MANSVVPLWQIVWFPWGLPLSDSLESTTTPALGEWGILIIEGGGRPLGVSPLPRGLSLAGAVVTVPSPPAPEWMEQSLV